MSQSFTVEWAGENLAPHALVQLCDLPAAADLSEAAQRIEALRMSLLFDSEGISGLHCVAEQHALLALSLLEQAWRHMQLADYEQAHALAHRGP